MAGLFMKQRILLLGVEHVVAAGVQTALSASDWATPVPFSGPPGTLLPQHLDGVEAVFNGTMGSPRAILANARALHDALEQRTAKDVRVVHLSSMTVYGSRTGEIGEGTALRMDVGAYGAAHVSAESLAGRHPRSVVLRPGCEYGPRCLQWSERIARLLCSHRLGDLGAYGDGICNLVYVDDLVAAIVKSLRLSGIDGQSLNLAMRSPPTWNEYFVRFARALGAVPVSRISGRGLKMETRLLAPPLKVLELAARRLPGRLSAVPPAITPSLLNLCNQNITLDSRKAEQALEIAWTPLTEGLRQAAAAFTSAYSSGNISMRRNSMG
jgi:nucleoside-diphosphate-sugar epimerase